MTRKRIAAGVALALFAAIYLLNASWLAPVPAGKPLLVAQRGLAQVYDRTRIDNDSCTAQFIPKPAHDLIDNTLPSMGLAFFFGAGMVELDVSATADGEFVAFHDYGLECRTNGKGPVGEKTLRELKTLDVGYGYTADGGRSFPLRGKGVGLMPSLGEVVGAFPGRRLMLQLKRWPDDRPERLVRYLEAHKADFRLLRFFGDDESIAALRRARPDANAWGQKEAGKCTALYIALGWSGYLPEACRGKTMLVPLAQRWLLPGWPNRFAQRMADGNVTMLVIGGADGLKSTGFWRVDTADDLARLPPGLPAEVWTDHVEVTGPLLRGQ